jgi:TetR/AcrR family tetracycline transcriptional repressor
MTDHNLHHRKDNLERLERKRELFNRRFELGRERMNARFDQKRAQLSGNLNTKQEEIITAALDLLNEAGLNSLSLRDIARRINMQAPALYWHFRNKEDLVDFMAEAILQKKFSNMKLKTENETWEEWFITHMSTLRQAMLAYKDGGRVVAGAHFYPAVTLAQFGEFTLESLTGSGVDIKTARHILMTATHYTFGYVIEEQSGPNDEEINNPHIVELFKSFPLLIQSMDENSLNPIGSNADYLTGLNYIITGSTSR